MKEDFLQIIWQMQCFSLPAISTEKVGIQVIKPGFRNKSDGPDFHHARIRMDGLEWNGSVEIHVRSADWKLHGHASDPAYDVVILHVVWEDDQPVFRQDGSRIPTLELQERIPLSLMLRYRELLQTKESLACRPFLEKQDWLIAGSMLDAALAQRLERRGHEILQVHSRHGFRWLRTAAILLARCLGMKGNEEPMEALIQSMPEELFSRAQAEPKKVLAFLLGQSGLVDAGKKEEWKSDFSLLKAAYGLQSLNLLWKKSGMRPASFPQKRLVLLAELLPRLDDFLLQLNQPEGGERLQSGFWTAHPGIEEGSFLHRHLLVNFHAPFMMARAIHTGQAGLSQQAIDLLHEIGAEENSSSKWLRGMGLPMQTAGHSQGGKELYAAWCQPRRCMECRIGIQALKGSSLTSGE